MQATSSLPKPPWLPKSAAPNVRRPPCPGRAFVKVTQRSNAYTALTITSATQLHFLRYALAMLKPRVMLSKESATTGIQTCGGRRRSSIPAGFFQVSSRCRMPYPKGQARPIRLLLAASVHNPQSRQQSSDWHPNVVGEFSWKLPGLALLVKTRSRLPRNQSDPVPLRVRFVCDPREKIQDQCR